MERMESEWVLGEVLGRGLCGEVVAATRKGDDTKKKVRAILISLYLCHF